MAHTQAYIGILQRDRFYHIFNRAVGNELLFRSEENYRFFLEKYRTFLAESVETISYCLLPNHFHFFVRVNDETNISTQWKRLFQSYALAYNKAYKRTGTLFERPFKRKEVNQNEHISRLVRYIHQNPQKHGYINDFKDWKWSSFNEVYGQNCNRVTSTFAEDWFLSKSEFDSFHDFFETQSSLE